MNGSVIVGERVEGLGVGVRPAVIHELRTSHQEPQGPATASLRSS